MDISLEQQSITTSFVEITGQSAETAKQFLQATNWRLEEAIQLFYIQNEGGGVASSSFAPSFSPAGQFEPPFQQVQPPFQQVQPPLNQVPVERENAVINESSGQDGGSEGVRAPLPVKRDILYDDALLYRAARMGFPPNEASSLVAFRNFDEEMKRPGVWEGDKNAASTTDNARDNLASLYRPPFALMHHGPFEKAKQAASTQDKWLLVNLQSTKEFSSHMLNRDTWSNEALAQTISTYFIFWQVYDDTTEGRKVCTYYKLDSIPAVLVIDPITGQKMRSWNGMIQPDCLLEDLLMFMDSGPKNHHVSHPHKRPRETSQTSLPKVQDETTEEDEEVLLALAASMENMKDTVVPFSADKDEPQIDQGPEASLSKKPEYPPLPEEPNVEKNLLCRVGVRLPDGRRLQRNFLRTDPIQLLWSFCNSHLEESESRPFRLTQAIPGVSKYLEYESKQTFQESGLANTMISVTFE